MTDVGASLERGAEAPPRRPDGWLAPGPAPRGRVPGAPDVRDDEDLSYLLGDWRIFQKKRGHRWSVDDLVTAWMARTCGGAPVHHVDLGCGIGSVLLMMAWSFPGLRSVGVEAQDVSASMARRSIRWNGCEDRVEVVHRDLRELRAGDIPWLADVVTGTPPYFPIGTAAVSPRVQRGPCRMELRGSVVDYVRAASAVVVPQGAVYVCDSALYDGRTQEAALANGLRVTKQLDVEPQRGKALLFCVYELRSCNDERPFARHRLSVRDGELFTPAYNALKRDMGLPGYGVVAPHAVVDMEVE